MRKRHEAAGATAKALTVLGLGLVFGGTLANIALAAGPGRGAGPGRIAQGQALFVKEWVPGAPSAHGGDGLGPVYNDTSCVACHNLGGTGGAGAVNKNIDLVSAVVTASETNDPSSVLSRLQAARRKMAESFGQNVPKPSPKGAPPNRDPLIKLHAGFRAASSVVLHRFGTNDGYARWHLQMLDPNLALMPRLGDMGVDAEFEAEIEMLRSHLLAMPTEQGDFTLFRTQRNPSPLFGAGLIDAIADSTLVAAARAEHPGFPEIRGRVHRLPDGRIGRFGWKARAATLDDFVLTACAVELGLEVPAQPQAPDPRAESYQAPGLDLTRAECDALTAFVASLPAPVVQRPRNTRDAAGVVWGRLVFDRIGCASCHTPQLADVDGLYSDLLLHDMGESLGDRGLYGALAPGSSADEEDASGIMPDGPLAFQGARAAVRGPSRREWRTPPLWGLRDSAPYLHDGRAETLEQAIALHGGEAQRTMQRYFRLSEQERRGVEAFLKSLVAPPPDARHPAPSPRRRPEHPAGRLDARLVSQEDCEVMLRGASLPS